MQDERYGHAIANLLEQGQIDALFTIGFDMNVADADCQQVNSGGTDELGGFRRIGSRACVKGQLASRHAARKLSHLTLDRDIMSVGELRDRGDASRHLSGKSRGISEHHQIEAGSNGRDYPVIAWTFIENQCAWNRRRGRRRSPQRGVDWQSFAGHAIAAQKCTVETKNYRRAGFFGGVDHAL
jgi:hypothetical protein